MYTINNENINNSVFKTEFNNKCAYYGNVVMWTTMFALPLYFLLDYLFLSDAWIDIVLIRLIGFGLSFLAYTLYKKGAWSFSKTITWFILFNVGVQALICGIVPSAKAFPYFVMLAIYFLIVCNTIFWEPKKSVYIFLLSLLIIFVCYSLKTRPDKYEAMLSNAGAIYFFLGLIACFLAYSRYKSLYKEVENNVLNGKVGLAENKTQVVSKPKTADSIVQPELEIKTITPKTDFVEFKEQPVVVDAPEKTEITPIKEISEEVILENTTEIAPEELSISEPIKETIETPIEEDKSTVLTTLEEYVAPAIAVVAPIIPSIIDNEKEDISSVSQTVTPLEKPKKSIHEEIEDTIRMLRGEKPREELTPVQSFVSPLPEVSETAESIAVEAPQVREVLENETKIDYNFVNSSLDIDNVEVAKTEEISVEAIDKSTEHQITETIANATTHSEPLVQITQDVSTSVNKQQLNLNDIVETTIIDLIDTIHLKDQSVQLNISPAANNIFQEKNSIENTIHTIIQHILRYSPSSSIITCSADRENNKAVVELTSHSAVDSGEKLSVIAEAYKVQGAQAVNLAESVGLGKTKVEIEKMGGSLYYNHTNDNSNYLKLELPSTQ